MKQRLRLGALLLVVMALASACTLTENSNYEVNNTGVSGINMAIYEMPTNQISVLYASVSGYNIDTAAQYLLDHIVISGWGAAEWNTGLTSGRTQLKSVLDDIIGQGALNNWDIGGPCIVLNKYVDWLYPWVFHQQWLSHGAGGDCKQGAVMGV